MREILQEITKELMADDYISTRNLNPTYGVRKSGSKFAAYLQHEGAALYLGTYQSELEATRAVSYAKAARHTLLGLEQAGIEQFDLQLSTDMSALFISAPKPTIH
jgi:hypothetical protein